jgi:hypothetical protein
MTKQQRKKHLLVVDDEPAFGLFAQVAAEALGFECW